MKKNLSTVYQKATTFFPWNVENYISNIIVKSLWTQNNLYYFQSRKREKWFIRINLLTGKKDKLFSFSELSRKLNELKNNEEEDTNAQSLTNLSVKEEGNTFLEFYYKKYRWLFIIESKELQKIDVYENHSLSPDEKWALEIKENNLFIKNLMKKESSQVTYDGEEYYNYAISPETNTCTVSNRINGKYLLPLAKWSPDSKKLITHKLDQRHVKDLYLLQNVPDKSFRPIPHKYKMSFSGDEIQPLAELQIIDIENKKILPVKTDPLLSPYLTAIEFGWVWWSADSQKIYFLRETRGSKEIILSSIDSHSGNG